MAAPPQQFDWKKQRFLLLDQDDQFRFWARGIFNRLGVNEVISTTSGFDALHAFDRGDATLALVDLQFKDMTAAGFIKAVRKKRSHRKTKMPVVLLVKSHDKKAIYEASLEGIEGIIVKPIAEKALLARVVSTLLDPKPIVLDQNFVGPDRREKPRLDPEPPKPAPVPRTSATPKMAAKPEPRDRARPAAAAVKPQGKSPPTPRPAEPAKAKAAPPAEPPAKKKADGSLGAADTAAPAKGGGRLSDEDILAAPAKPEVRDFSAEVNTTPKKTRASDEDWKSAVAPKKKEKKKKKRRGGPSVDLPAILEAHQAWLDSNGRDGEKARLEGADLTGADLAGANLVNASMRGANLSDSDCSGAQMTSAELRRANLSGAYMAGADLSYATMRHVNLTLADLSGATLVGADLAGATFAKANVKKADLTGASLLGADLDNAELDQVAGLTQAQVGKAYGTKTTKLPAGLRAGSPEEWSDNL